MRITVDANGAIESINQSAEQMFGYGASEVLGEKFFVLLKECCRNTCLDQMQGVSGDHVTHSFVSDECEGLGQRQDGSTFPIELAINQVTVKGWRLLIHIVRDITGRKQADSRATGADVKQYVYQLRSKIERDPHSPQWIQNVKGF